MHMTAGGLGQAGVLTCGIVCAPLRPPLLQTAAAYEEQGYVDPDSMAALPEDEETLAKV
jgi:hypothetical protein